MTTNTFTFEAATLDDTDRFGAALAASLEDGTTVCLSGTLGAGKTRLVQAMAVACGVHEDNVVSPTFVLCQHYAGSRSFHHLDAYRIRDDDEFLELGVDEMFASDGITLVEWGETVKDCLPLDRVDIKVHVRGDTERAFEVILVGSRNSSLIESLQISLAS